MPNILDLPMDVLRHIFSRCKRRVLTLTCRRFLTVVYSIPAFSSISIGPRQLVPDGVHCLRTRLQRISTIFPCVSIGPFDSHVADAALIIDMCTRLSEYSAHIHRLELTAEGAFSAGTLLNTIFSDLTSDLIFPTLRELSIRVQLESIGDYISKRPQLDSVLERAAHNFPNLEVLSLPDFSECLPSGNVSFQHLHTLVLDGSRAGRALCIRSVIGLLQNTPRLETLWVKNVIRGEEYTGELAEADDIKHRKTDRLDVVLPLLTRLTLSAPGSSLALLHYLESPALHDLHLDGSRDPDLWENPDESFYWPAWGGRVVVNAMKSLARRSPVLKRLAVTAIYLTEEDWDWIIFGGPPFPKLECLAIHWMTTHFGHPEESPCGFNESLLMRFAENPVLPLRRLAILWCDDLALQGIHLAELVMSRFNGTRTEGFFELELDACGPLFDIDVFCVLLDAGMKIIRRSEVVLDDWQWWNHKHRVDPHDSHSY